jgi:hypothetical protein
LVKSSEIPEIARFFWGEVPGIQPVAPKANDIALKVFGVDVLKSQLSLGVQIEIGLLRGTDLGFDHIIGPYESIINHKVTIYL